MKKPKPDSSPNATRKSESVVESTSEPDIIWDGVTESETLTQEGVKLRQDLADFSKNYNWPKVLDLLSEYPELVNSTRPGGHSWAGCPRTLLDGSVGPVVKVV
jgi:hypothetical protein